MPPSTQIETMIDVQPSTGCDRNNRLKMSVDAYNNDPNKTKTPQPKIILRGAALNEVMAFTA